MKNTFKALMAVLAVLVVMAGCTKEPPLFFYHSATTPGLSISGNSFAWLAKDSNSYKVKVMWDNPEFATSLPNTKFITQIDLAGRNFSNPLTSTVTGGFSDSFQNKTINKFILDNGVRFGEFANLEVRMISSYANNNDQKISGSLPFKFMAYKVPPRVQLPPAGRLFIVGSATQGGWANAVPTPSQEFARLSETSWGGVFQLTGGGQYLMLPVNGSWDHKYAVANSGLAGLEKGGDFGYDFSSNIPGPVADGLYKILVDFQTGKFTVEPFTMQHGLPTQLVAVGGATPWGWNNSLNNPQKFSRLNSVEFRLGSIQLKANDGYLILPVPGSWDRKYGVPNNSIEAARLEGDIKPEGSDFKSPTVAGNYMIYVNFFTGKYKLTKI